MQRDGGPGGPAGGANPTGGSFTGPAEALEIIGNHCFAYSGSILVENTPSSATVRLLSFTSGNYYAKIRLTFSNTVTSSTANEFYLIKMNGSTVYIAENEHGLDTVTNPMEIHLIIPPYTVFEALVGASTDGYYFSSIISGRIYRG